VERDLRLRHQRGDAAARRRAVRSVGVVTAP
jgi:hypothetical protein